MSKCVYSEYSFARRYERLSLGTSRQDVIELFGRPDEVVTCNNDDCKDYLIYVSFMERRGIVFDASDRVTGKFYNSGSF
jgi:hypothetical protein